MNTESGMISGLDNTMPGGVALMSPAPRVSIVDGCSSADNCINPWCGKQIPSQRQIDIPGVETCGNCSKVDSHEEER